MIPDLVIPLLPCYLIITSLSTLSICVLLKLDFYTGIKTIPNKFKCNDTQTSSPTLVLLLVLKLRLDKTILTMKYLRGKHFVNKQES